MKFVTKLFQMDDATWKRHANPWSFWTRVPLLPLFALAIWSRVWINSFALIPLVLLTFWTWWNPRAFPVIESVDCWESKAVLGEKIWLEMDVEERPGHWIVPSVLAGMSLLGLVPFVWGLFVLQLWPTVFGMVVAMLLKFWFVDRMVWLYETIDGSLHILKND